MTDPEIFDIIFLRHGESVGNAESRWQGQADFPLTDKGREQAQSLANRWLREKRTFDHIYTSPQKRAGETAKIIGAALDVPVEPDPIWMERNIGEIAGMTSEEVRQKFPHRTIENPYAPILGNEGEGNWELYLRAGHALHSLLQHPPAKYLIVSHGGLLNQLMYAVVGTVPQANFSGPRFRFKNTGFAHLTYKVQTHQWFINTDFRPFTFGYRRDVMDSDKIPYSANTFSGSMRLGSSTRGYILASGRIMLKKFGYLDDNQKDFQYSVEAYRLFGRLFLTRATWEQVRVLGDINSFMKYTLGVMMKFQVRFQAVLIPETKQRRNHSLTKLPCKNRPRGTKHINWIKSFRRKKAKYMNSR